MSSEKTRTKYSPLKISAAVRSDPPFAYLPAGTLLPINAPVLRNVRVVGNPQVILAPLGGGQLDVQSDNRTFPVPGPHSSGNGVTQACGLLPSAPRHDQNLDYFDFVECHRLLTTAENAKARAGPFQKGGFKMKTTILIGY